MAEPKLRVLIAEDEPDTREWLRIVLEPTYDLDFAHDGEEALRKLIQSNAAVALLDVKMPKLDGLEVLKRLRAEGRTTPVLLLTAYQSIELAREAVKLGADDYLPKPLEREPLLHAIRLALTPPG